MNLLDELRLAAAAACDYLADVVDMADPKPAVEISVVISHPGRTDDAIVVGSHELPQLLALFRAMTDGTHEVAGGTVKGASYTADYPPHGTVQ